MMCVNIVKHIFIGWNRVIMLQRFRCRALCSVRPVRDTPILLNKKHLPAFSTDIYTLRIRKYL